MHLSICKAIFDYLHKTSFICLISVAPQMQIKPNRNPVIKAEGDEFKLICVVSGTPVPTIRWTKEGRIFPYKKVG